jgi:hypothetical protein
MHGKIILVTLLCYCGNVFAQSGFSEKPFETTIEVFDANGRPFTNPGIDIAGSPFYTDEWTYADIRLYSNKELTNVKLRLNLQTQEIHFLSKNNSEMACPAGMIKEVRFHSAAADGKGATEFQSGFPPVDHNSTTDFYQVLSKGKSTLLRSLKKSISVQKDQLSGEVKKEFVLYEEYYLLHQDILKRLKRDRSFIIAMLADKKDKIEDFVRDKKLKYKSFDEIRQIIDYYNSLP